MASKDIGERIGLDYLIQSAPPPAESAPASSVAALGQWLQGALIAKGGAMLQALRNQPNHADRLYNLVDHSGIELETLLTIINQLEKLGLVSYVARDKHGNHEIALTPAGMQAVA